MTDLPNRRHCVTHEIGPVAVSVGFDPRNGAPCEVFFTKRMKTGTEIETLLYDIGVEASRIMQGKD